MIGEKFGMLTIIKKSERKTNDRGSIWICQCDCGKIKEVSLKLLRNESKPRSCGCSRKIRAQKKFESHFEKTEGCWIWKGNLNKGGYGKFGSKSAASRLSYQYYVGEIPKGLQVCHTCDVRSCVNPGHLFLGTIGQNMNDRTKKNRQAKGSKLGNTKLNEEIVLQIRIDRLSGMKYKDICIKYNISQRTLRHICKNDYWKHVSLGEECSNYKSSHDKNKKQHNRWEPHSMTIFDKLDIITED